MKTGRASPLPSALAKGFAVRLGRVSSGTNLRERIAHRDTEFEIAYYDELRWTERPEVYLRRALGRALFDRHALPHAQFGRALTLDAELIAFEEVRLPTLRAARIQLRWHLSDNERVVREQTVTMDRPLDSAARIEDMVAALAAVLETAAESIAAGTEATIQQLSSAPASNGEVAQ
jgi:cholesterol transport system auxiliary component